MIDDDVKVKFKKFINKKKVKKVQIISETSLQIAINAKNIRELLKLTQAQFANLIGMPLPTLKKWDSKNYSPKKGYSSVSAIKLSKLTGIERADLEKKEFSQGELFELLDPIKETIFKEVGKKDNGDDVNSGSKKGRLPVETEIVHQAVSMVGQQLQKTLKKELSEATDKIINELRILLDKGSETDVRKKNKD